jgi:GntR family transcriptional regulator, transcriptional repressor for pyruvate dehydrogenase complex
MSATTVFTKLDRAPAYRRVSDLVGQMITSGEISLGDWLPTEAELSAQLGVNRSTVREGLRGLEHEGLVKRDGKRLRVSLPHYTELASRASRALVMHQVTFRELFEVSMVLETTTAMYAARRITPDAIAALKNNVKEMAARIDDIDAVVSLDIEFHDIIAEAADNRALSLAREPISLLFYPAGKTILSRLKTQKRVLVAHRKIVALLTKPDEAGVQAWMGRHIADMKRGYERVGVKVDSAVDNAQ